MARTSRAAWIRFRKPSASTVALLLVVGLLIPVLRGRPADAAGSVTQAPALTLDYVTANSPNTVTSTVAANNVIAKALPPSATINAKITISKSGGDNLPSAATSVSLFDSVDGGAETQIAGKGCTPVFTAATTLACATAATVSIASDGTFTLTNHRLTTGDVFRFAYVQNTTSINTTTNYFAVRLTDNTFKVATTYANATAATPTTINTVTAQSASLPVFATLGRVKVTNTGASSTALFTLPGHGYANGTPISFLHVLPATSPATGTQYYVINSTTDTFQLATAAAPATAITMTQTTAPNTAWMTIAGVHLTLTAGYHVIRAYWSGGDTPGGTPGTDKYVPTYSSTIEVPTTSSAYISPFTVQVGATTTTATYRAVSFVDATDRVSVAGHGLSNGDTVAFSSITSTTGISTTAVYYVVNRATNDFQLAASTGGAALPLTTDGSGMLVRGGGPVLPASDPSGGTALRFDATLVKPFLGSALADPATITFQAKPGGGAWADLGSCTAMADAPGTQDNVKCTANATFDTSVSNSTFTLANHGFTAAASVRLAKVTGTVGVVAPSTLWPVNVTTDTFQLSSTQNGPALTLPESATTGSIDIYRGVDLRLPTAATYQLRARWAGGGTYVAGTSRSVQFIARSNDLAWDTSGSPAKSPDAPVATSGATGAGTSFTYLATSAGTPAFTPLTYAVSGFSPATIDASERQQIALSTLTAGYSYYLQFDGPEGIKTSTQITQANHNASAATAGSVRYALNEVLGAGNWTTDLATTDAGVGNFNYRIFFRGALATRNVAQIVVSSPFQATPTVTSVDGGSGVATGTHITMGSTGTLAVSGTVPAGTYTASVTVSHVASGASLTKPITITVNPPPVSTLAVPAVEFTAGGDADFTPVTVTGGTPPYTFSAVTALPPGLSIDGATGAITGSPLYAKTATAYTIAVKDWNNVEAATQDVLITVLAGIGIAGKDVLSLAPSATLTSDYTLSGGASASWQTAVYADAASDLGALSADLTKTATSMSVTLGATAPVAPFFVLVDAEVLKVTADAGGGAFTVSRAQLGTTAARHATNAVVTLLPAATTDPDGLTDSPLSFDASTGRLTVAAPGGPTSYTVVLTAVESRGSTSALVISVTVKAGLIATQEVVSSTFEATTPATPITPYTPVAASGAGPGTLSYAVSPALPEGLTLNPTTGVIDGSPSKATTRDRYTITITETLDGLVVDSASASTWIEVKGALRISTLVPSTEATLGVRVDYKPVEYGGGQAPLTVTLSPALPSSLGLTFSNGRLSGTPKTVLPLTTYTVTVKDYNFPATAAVTASFQFKVNPAITASRGCATTADTALQMTQGSSVNLPIEECPAFIRAQLTAGSPGTIGLTAHGLAVGDPVRFVALTAGSGLSTGTTYFVKTQTTNSFTIAATVGGAALAISANGYGRLASAVIDPNGNRVATPAQIFAAGDVLRFASLNGASDPVGGVAPGTVYYVKTAGASFQIATTSGGAAVTISAQAIGRLRVFTAVGGTAPLTYKLEQAPSGLVMDASTGYISGTPTSKTDGARATKVTITDANTATKVFSATGNSSNALWINSAPAISFGGLQQVETTTGIEYAGGGVTITGGNRTFYDFTLCGVYSLVPLTPCTVNEISAVSPDPGITWDSASRRVTVGTSVAPGTYSVALTSYDTLGASGTASVPVKVNPWPVAITDLPTIALTQGQSAGDIPSATWLSELGPSARGPIPVTGDATTGTAISGTARFLYQISPSLPSGLYFSSSTGQITGTPSAASASATYTVRVSDLRGAFVNAPITITVNPSVKVRGRATVGVPVEEARTFTYSSTGGTGSVALSATGDLPDGALPTGITFDGPTGVLSVADTTAEGIYAVTVTGTDANGATGSKIVTVKVSSGILAIEQIEEVELTQGSPAPVKDDVQLPPDIDFIPVIAEVAKDTVTFTISDPEVFAGLGLAFDAATGEITGTPTAPLSRTLFTVTVTDGITSSSAGFHLTVNASPEVEGNLTVRATLGTEKTSAAYTVVGGTGPFTFSADDVVDGSLTPVEGIAFDPDTQRFTIADTVPSGTYATTVRVTDSYEAVGSLAVAITVSAGFLATAVLGATEADPIQLTATGSTNVRPVTPSGGTSPYSYTVSPALPASLVLNAASGQISGSAASDRDNAEYTITIRDDNGVTRSAGFWLVVNPSLNALVRAGSSYELVEGETKGLPFTPVTLAETPGGTAPYEFEVRGGGLPKGLAIDPDTGEISGVPTEKKNATTVTIRVTDANGVYREQTFSLTVYAAIEITAPASMVLTEGYAKTGTFSATGGKGTKGFEVLETTLPEGSYVTQINPSNSAQWQLIVGATVEAGEYSATIRATDGLAVQKDVTVPIRVYPVPEVTTAIASIELTAQFSGGTSVIPVTLTADTGAPPVTFGVEPALPSGLSIRSSDGTLRGTPAGASPLATYTVTATDANGVTASSTFDLKVNPTLFLDGPAAISVTAGYEKVTLFSGSGGTPARSMTIAYTGASSTDAGIGWTVVGDGPTGTLTVGASTSVGTYSLLVTLDDARGQRTRTVTVTVYPAPVATQAAPSTELVAGSGSGLPFTPVTVSGGAPTLTYSLSAPALPSGLVWDSATGTISGAPTLDTNGVTTTRTVTATDGNGVTAAATFALKVLRVQPSLSVANGLLTNKLSTVKTNSVLNLLSSGGAGTGAVTFAVTVGADVCSVSGNQLTGLKAGTCTVVASRAGDATYAPATSAGKTFTWTKADQAALVLPAAAGSVGTPMTLAATGGSGDGALTYAITGSSTASCSVVGDQHSATLGATVAGGTCTVTVTKATDEYYLVRSLASTMTWTAVPALASGAPAQLGFALSLTNYNANFTYTPTTTAGTVTAGTASGTTRPYTVSSLVAGTCATVTITVSRLGYATRTAQITGCTSSPTLTLTTPSSRTSDGFTTTTAATAGYTYAAEVTGGTGTATIRSITTVVTVDVTGVTDGPSTVTITRTRPGFATAMGATTATALPAIASISPSPAKAGSVVTITGKNLWGATAVSLGGVSASRVTVIDGQTVLATVPRVTTARTGAVTITTPGGTSSAIGAPSITVGTALETLAFTELSSTSGGRGSAVIITGTNLGGATSILARLSTATTGGTTVTFRPLNANQLLVAIPSLTASATKYVFAVTTPAGTLVTPVATGGGYQVISTPATVSATAISPSLPKRGTLVVLEGLNLGAATAVAVAWAPAGTTQWTANLGTTYAGLGTGRLRILVPVTALPGYDLRFTITVAGGTVVTYTTGLNAAGARLP